MTIRTAVSSRRGIAGAAAATALTAATALAVFPAAAQAANAPGDNGTVKIHDAKTGAEFLRNEPHVCAFYLDAFFFDGGQKFTWEIQVWAPTDGTKGEVVKSGALDDLKNDGHERTADIALPNGHYKLFWDFEGKNGAPKHKVFWVECDAQGNPPVEQPSGSPTPSTSEKPTGTPTPGGSTSGTPTVNPTASSPAPIGGSGSPAPGAPAESGGSDGGSLAATGGMAVGGLAVVAAGLVGGGYLLRRRAAAAAAGASTADAED